MNDKIFDFNFKFNDKVFQEKKNALIDALIPWNKPLKVFKLNENAKLPTKAHDGDAGWDLYYCGDSSIKVHAGETVIVPTGIAIVVDSSFVAIVKEKSGLSSKGVSIHAGVVDSNYRGEVGVVVSYRSMPYIREDTDGNISLDDDYYVIESGQKIAQVMIVPCSTIKDVIELDKLPETERGDGGFGSTGI